MTSQQQLVCDSSTVANYIQWASAISNFFRTAGWINSTDTGQLNGAGAGNWAGVTTVPGSGLFYYEVFEPNDGLTNYYLKLEYGNLTGSTNCPSLRFTVGTTTNGAGTMTGEVMGPYTTNENTFTPVSTTAQYECDFSGAAGRMQVIMWRNATSAFNQAFSIERSVNSSGTYTGTHLTLVTVGTVNNAAFTPVNQQTLLFGTGAAPAHSLNSGTGNGGICARLFDAGNTSSTSAFNGSIPFDTVSPILGVIDYALTGVGIASEIDIAEGVPFLATLYGATRTYIPSKLFNLAVCGPKVAACALCMRYD